MNHTIKRTDYRVAWDDSDMSHVEMFSNLIRAEQFFQMLTHKVTTFSVELSDAYTGALIQSFER